MTASIGVVASSLRLLMQLALASLAHAQTFVAISAMPASRQFCVGDVISYTASLQVIDHNPQNQSDVTIENVFLIGPSGFALQIVNGEYAKTSSFQIYTVPESIRGMVDLFLRGTAFYSSNPNELLVSQDSSPTFSIANHYFITVAFDIASLSLHILIRKRLRLNPVLVLAHNSDPITDLVDRLRYARSCHRPPALAAPNLGPKQASIRLRRRPLASPLAPSRGSPQVSLLLQSLSVAVFILYVQAKPAEAKRCSLLIKKPAFDRAQVPAAAPTMFWRTSEQIDYLIPMSVTPTPRPASPHAFAASNASSAYAASTASVDSKPAKNDIRAATPAASRGSRTPEPPPPSEPAAITSNAASLPEQPTLFSGVQDVVEALAAADRSWRRWTPAEVASALSGEGVASSTVSLFLANEIDGLVLRSVDDAFLTEELSISGAAEREAVMAAVRRVRRDDDDEGGEEGEFGSQRMFESEGRPPPYLA
ncbi:hypothetical protein DFJ73DRAFT_766652 [Zopfochytrium polystomum]|nr:hypothetical protein DFJ73DRAFT_766652 [Zopfochytrium polystomum]